MSGNSGTCTTWRGKARLHCHPITVLEFIAICQHFQRMEIVEVMAMTTYLAHKFSLIDSVLRGVKSLVVRYMSKFDF